MKKRLCKTALFLCICGFAISSAFARSQNPRRGLEGSLNGSSPAEQHGKKSSKSKENQNKKVAGTDQTEPLYLGNVQFSFGYATGTASYYEEHWKSSSGYYGSYTYEKETSGAEAFISGLENHNLFRVTSFRKINIYVGFMESLFYDIGSTYIWESLLGGEIAVKFSKVALVQAGLGLDVGIVMYPCFFVAPACYFELQAKFFPNAVFSPVIGMKFTKFSDTVNDYPASVSSNAFFVGGSWNFRSKNRH